jgi:hypothetical protein
VATLNETMRLTEEGHDLNRSWPVSQTKQPQRAAVAAHCAHRRHIHSCDTAVVDADLDICYSGATVGRCS